MSIRRNVEESKHENVDVSTFRRFDISSKSGDAEGSEKPQTLMLERLAGSLVAIESLRDQVDLIASMADLIVAKLQAGGTIYTAGNGGSAAQAMHLAEELIGRYRASRPPLRAICLNADPTALTCIANDFGYEHVFARQCEALLTPKDALVVFSTSGKSRNIVEALRAGRSNGAICIGILGKDGGECLELCDPALVVSTSATHGDSAHIQEAHQVVLHLICEVVERKFDSGFNPAATPAR